MKSSPLELLDELQVLSLKPYRYVYLSGIQFDLIYIDLWLRLSTILFPFFLIFFGQGVGGIVELAPGYLQAVHKSIRKAGGLCIADEVQSGFARTGSHFWGFEGHGVVPDIVTMAKVNSRSPCITANLVLLNSLPEYFRWKITSCKRKYLAHSVMDTPFVSVFLFCSVVRKLNKSVQKVFQFKLTGLLWDVIRVLEMDFLLVQ